MSDEGHDQGAVKAHPTGEHMTVERRPDGVVQLRFTGPPEAPNQVSARLLADALQGLVELSGELGRSGMYGDGPAPELRAMPPEEGSFEINIVPWVLANPEGAAALITGVTGTAAAVVHGIRVATKSLRARPKDIDRLGDGTSKILWTDDTVDVVPDRMADDLMRQRWKTKKALRKIAAPMSGSATKLEIRSAPDEASRATAPTEAPEVTLTRDDYEAAMEEPAEETVDVDVFETEGQLASLSFEKGANRWKIKTVEPKRSRMVTVMDDEFLTRVDHGLALRKTDIFEFLIRSETMTHDGKSKESWEILKVTSHRRGAFDEDDAEGAGGDD